MAQDGAFLADVLIAASKLLAQEAVNIRYSELGVRSISNECVGTINAAVRCQMLAEKFRGASR